MVVPHEGYQFEEKFSFIDRSPKRTKANYSANGIGSSPGEAQILIVAIKRLHQENFSRIQGKLPKL